MWKYRSEKYPNIGTFNVRKHVISTSVFLPSWSKVIQSTIMYLQEYFQMFSGWAVTFKYWIFFIQAFEFNFLLEFFSSTFHNCFNYFKKNRTDPSISVCKNFWNLSMHECPCRGFIRTFVAYQLMRDFNRKDSQIAYLCNLSPN